MCGVRSVSTKADVAINPISNMILPVPVSYCYAIYIILLAVTMDLLVWTALLILYGIIIGLHGALLKNMTLSYACCLTATSETLLHQHCLHLCRKTMSILE